MAKLFGNINLSDGSNYPDVDMIYLHTQLGFSESKAFPSALSAKNLSSGFPIMSDTNQPVQLQLGIKNKLAIILSRHQTTKVLISLYSSAADQSAQ